ncbi:MAG: hypothetical protein IKV88_07930 [Clostridia bacterium]|nr:hypothetical protein [Clostridia bacterium]
MIKQMSQSVAYICPTCAAVTGRLVNIFHFSGKRTSEYSCEAKGCDTRIAKISEKGDKYIIFVECAFCGGNHTFTISKNSFWNKDFLAFTCPVSEMNVFYIGSTEKIREEVQKQEEELSELSEEFMEENDLSILFDVLSELNDMLKENAIICECGSDSITLDVNPDGIIISCSDCNASMTIIPSEEEYQRLSNTESLVIKK